ncbi:MULTISPECIES: hypothetical protein [Haloarcula]|uniref:hypothetical protein n=1 Tax=Haloarcula TaxID=2237 RepID=UPI0023E76BD4|nr:hypothetical protein [Halomicroarcula sp. SHR3]
MALRNALPNPLEWPGQLSYDGENLYQWFAAASVSLGSMGATAMFALSMLTFAQLSFANFVYELTFPSSVPVVGGVLVFPFLTLMGGVVAVPIAFGMINIATEKSGLYDDANGMMVFSALTLIIAGTQTAFDFSELLLSVLLSVGVVYLGLYVARVVNIGRRNIGSSAN